MEHLDNLFKSESLKRKAREKYLQSLKTKLVFQDIPDNCSYSRFECDLCTNYGFFSMMKCLKCEKKTCINHKRPCQCNYKVMFSYRKLEL